MLSTGNSKTITRNNNDCVGIFHQERGIFRRACFVALWTAIIGAASRSFGTNATYAKTIGEDISASINGEIAATQSTGQYGLPLDGTGTPVGGDPLRNNAYVFAHNGMLGYPTAREIRLPMQDSKAPIVAQAPAPEHMLEALTLCGYAKLPMTPETPNISRSE